MPRAWTKLELAFGLGHASPRPGVNQFDHQQKLGEIWSMLEMTRAGVVAAEAGVGTGRAVAGLGSRRAPVRGPARPGPQWIPRAFEILKLLGGTASC